MQAMAIAACGNTDVFEAINLPKPAVKPGHVLIKVAATSVNPLDCKLRQGVMPTLLSSFPIILHGDAAGVVEAVGEGVSRFSPGDEVYGCAGGLLEMGGALAEYLLADADLMAHKPKTLTMLEAAALPLVALTVWEALIRYAQVQKNQTVLVHAGTGGVGHIAIQLAKWLGARVFATVSNPEKAAIAHSLGADEVINYQQMTVEEYVNKYTHDKGFDVVLDTVGGDNLPLCFKAATLFGKVVSIQARGTFDLSPAFLKGLSIHTVLQPLPLITGIDRAHYGDILTKVAHLVDEGHIKPLLDEKQFNMQEIAMAHQRLESGDAIGKVVVKGF